MHPVLAFSQLLPAMAWISISALFFTAGDVLFRSWFQSYWSFGFIIALAVYIIGACALVMSFPSENIAVATVIAILANITLYLIAAYFIYGDMISIRESMGLLLGFAAIYVLEGMK